MVRRDRLDRLLVASGSEHRSIVVSSHASVNNFPLKSNPLIQVPLGLIHKLIPTLANIAQGLRCAPEVSALVHDGIGASGILVQGKGEARTVLRGVGLELHAPIVVCQREYARKKVGKANRPKCLLHKDLRAARPPPALNPCRART